MQRFNTETNWKAFKAYVDKGSLAYFEKFKGDELMDRLLILSNDLDKYAAMNIKERSAHLKEQWNEGSVYSKFDVIKTFRLHKELTDEDFKNCVRYG